MDPDIKTFPDLINNKSKFLNDITLNAIIFNGILFDEM